jgi:integral membrane protein (TIGR01906 family)
VRRLPLILSLVVALAVPAVLLGNGLWLLTNDWYVHAEYARPGFPDDRYGFTKAERTELALVGLESIHPFNGTGVQVLRDARLPDGQLAFGAREIQHMDDVRGLVGSVLLAHLIALSAIVIVWFAARARGLRGVVSTGLLRGSVLTLALAAAIGLTMLVSFDWFFVQFHEALFTGDTWRFASTDTLLRLYPDAFWSDFGGVLAGLTILQALALGGGLWLRRRRQLRTADPHPAVSAGRAGAYPRG